MTWNGDNTKTDVYYFLDYSRLLLESEIHEGHHVKEYTRILGVLDSFINTVMDRLDKMTGKELYVAINIGLNDIILSVRHASNHTPLMRALVRADEAMRAVMDKVKL